MLLKNAKSHPEQSIIKVRVLILVYSLLCILTVFFSRNFFAEILEDGNVPDQLNLIVFFTIPVVFLIILGISVFSLIMDFIYRRPGSKFNARLLFYFTLIVIFSITPITLITTTALTEIVRFWQNIDSSSSIKASNSFVADNYSLHLENFENILRQNDFSRFNTAGSRLPQNIASVQIFMFIDGNWAEASFTGDEKFRLLYPPSNENGFPQREMPRDAETIRYIQRPSANINRVISYGLGADFDWGKDVLENQTMHFETIDMLRANIRPLLLYYYIVFFLPTLLMTVIIAISFTRRITHPIVELTEATRRVAEGNFSIQILSRRNDELGLLIRSFNAMVQDLEKSRAALVKSEKISIWQNMAQQLAHEIKNPLTPIKLSAERVLRRWQNEPENIGEILESSMMAIIQETEGLSSLLNEFRTLSKPTEPAKVWTILREQVEEIVHTYSNSYPGVNFNIDYVEAGISIKIDKNRLTQILTNLIINAIDAMNGSGSIEIRTDILKKREVCFCRLSIKDSGKGIKEQETNLVFTPYYTTKEAGTGLGLPIIERIVNDHGGSIWFDTAEGTGTTFYIDLPAELS
ncbi:MAG: HAMP domain-containing protein [Treponema sp.]|jgi:nitrogen fixation/metabolism regulation signal transduction histidine kinase|nr:HAMP domain-containing protein [Treponema sp.]